jgi:hypothetical protein
VHHRPASIAGRRSSSELSLQLLRSSKLTAKGREGEWSTGDSMGHSSEARWWRGSRTTEEGGGGRRLAVGARSDVREEVRRMVWGEVR